MKEIKLTNGRIALVDDEDYPLLSRHTWSNSGGYARTTIAGVTLQMQRFILGALKGLIVDHIDRNPLNNQKSNLRWTNKAGNALNTGLRRDSKTGYKGIRKMGVKYQAYTGYNGRQLSFGTFSTIEEAINARHIGLQRLHGKEYLQDA